MNERLPDSNKSTKYIEENIDRTLLYIDIRDVFSDCVPLATNKNKQIGLYQIKVLLCLEKCILWCGIFYVWIPNNNKFYNKVSKIKNNENKI